LQEIISHFPNEDAWQSRTPTLVDTKVCRSLDLEVADGAGCTLVSAARGTADVALVHGECEGDACEVRYFAFVPESRVPIEIRVQAQTNYTGRSSIDVTLDHEAAVVDLGVDLSQVDDWGRGRRPGTALYSLKTGQLKQLTEGTACVVSGRGTEILCRGRDGEVLSVDYQTAKQETLVVLEPKDVEIVGLTIDDPGPPEVVVKRDKLRIGLKVVSPSQCSNEYACEVEAWTDWPPKDVPTTARLAPAEGK
jgi:hypothetical protein